jgi:TonB family protein
MIRTIGVFVATLGIAVAVGCASRPAPSLAPAAAVAPGPQLAGLVLDPRGADFTDWINDFKSKVHHNWVPPTYFGYGGKAEFSFTVERNGSVSALQMLKSAGTDSLDRAAHDALTRSHLEPLPADFEPPRVTMQVTFVYGPPPGE